MIPLPKNRMKKYSYTRITTVLLAVVIVLAMLVGCNEDSPSDIPVDMSNYRYVAEYISLPNYLKNVNSLIYINDKLYFTADTFENEKTDITITNVIYYSQIYSINIDGTELMVLDDYSPFVTKPEQAESGGSNISKMIADSDGNLWIIENWNFYNYDLPFDFDVDTDIDEVWLYQEVCESGNALRKLSATGAELLSVDVDSFSVQQENIRIISINIDNLNNIYLVSEGSIEKGRMTSIVYVLDKSGKLKFSFDIDNRLGSLVRLSDGSIALVDSSNTTVGSEGYEITTVKKINLSAKNLNQTGSIIRYMGGRYMTGNTGYDAFVSNSDGIYGLTVGDDSSVKLLSWYDYDIENDIGINCISLIPDERIICIDGTVNDYYMLLIFTKLPLAELTEKTVITLGTIYPWFIRSYALAFNRENPDYRIEIIDYSELVSSETSDRNAFASQLAIDVISGKGPDILDLTFLPHKELITSGVFSDIYSFIDSDPEYNRDDFVQAAFKAAEFDGKLPYVFWSFDLSAIVGHPSVLGEEPDWSTSEFFSIIDDHPEADWPFGQFQTNEEVLQSYVLYAIDNYINWETGEAFFNSTEFVQMLELIGTLPADIEQFGTRIKDDVAVAAGRQIMDVGWFGTVNLNNFHLHKAKYGGEIVLKNYPNADSGEYFIRIDSGLAITEYSENKEAAWLFLRTFYDEDWQVDHSNGFSTNQAAFDRNISSALKGETEHKRATTDALSGGIVFEDLTQEDIDQISTAIDLVSGTSLYWQIGGSVMDIVDEETSDYFNGFTNAQVAAERIQSRVSIMLSERRH